LKCRLQDVGFEGIARNAFAATVGELIHVVLLGRDRHGMAYVEAKIWHEDFAIPGEDFSPRNLASPVRGMVGPEGVISSWTWTDVDEVSQHIAHVVSGFSACFSTMQDIRTAVGQVEEGSPQWRQLYGPRPESRASAQGPFGSFRPVVSRAVSQEGALQLACNAFLPFAAASGFAHSKDAGSLVLFRDRGEIVDCIRFSTDLFQTFGQLEVFPWSRAVWRAERRLKGRYLPITSRRREDPASLWIKSIHEIGPDCVEEATEWLGNQLHAQEAIRSTDDFIAKIDPMYSTIRSQLAMARAVNSRE
jgi:hypothetical protein